LAMWTHFGDFEDIGKEPRDLLDSGFISQNILSFSSTLSQSKLLYKITNEESKFKGRYQFHKNLAIVTSNQFKNQLNKINEFYKLSLNIFGSGLNNEKFNAAVGLKRRDPNVNFLKLSCGLHIPRLFYSNTTFLYPLNNNEKKKINVKMCTNIPIMKDIDIGLRLSSQMNITNPNQINFHEGNHKFDAALAYSLKKTKLILRSSLETTPNNPTHLTFGVSYFQHLSNRSQCAVDLDRDLFQPLPTMRIGYTTLIDNLSSIKARGVITHIPHGHLPVESDCRLGLTYYRKFSDMVRLGFSVDLGLRNLLGDKNTEGPHVGLTFTRSFD